jgi:hypothetical protein
MHLQIDGDVIKYRAGFAAEKMHHYLTEDGIEIHFDYKKELNEHVKLAGLKEGDYTIRAERIAEPVENALHNVKSIINDICKDMGVTSNDITVYLSGPSNYRTSVGDICYRDKPVPGYKAHRKEAHRPVHGPAIVEYLKRHYNCVETVDEEADDAMGIAQYAMWLTDPESTCIVTVDKDLDMIPGWHFNFPKKDQYFMDAHSADMVFWRQLLTGDSTDNIPGLAGVGPKTALKLFPDPLPDEYAYMVALGQYEEKYAEEAAECLLENARMIWIRREKNEFWKPPENEVE